MHESTTTCGSLAGIIPMTMIWLRRTGFLYICALSRCFIDQLRLDNLFRLCILMGPFSVVVLVCIVTSGDGVDGLLLIQLGVLHRGNDNLHEIFGFFLGGLTGGDTLVGIL